MTPEQLIQAELRRREKHNEASRLYRLTKQDKEKWNEYMKEYNRKRRALVKSLMPPKVVHPPKQIEIPVITPEPPPPKKGRTTTKYTTTTTTELVPKHLTRDKPLEPKTIEVYSGKINIINKLILGKNITSKTKQELIKLYSDSKNVNEDAILNELAYLKDIEPTIKKLRAKYPNDATFMSYINVLTVITGHIPRLRNEYLILSKINKSISVSIQQNRDKNIVEDEDNLIDLNDKMAIWENVFKLKNLRDEVLYLLYCYIQRRLENRLLVLTKETNLKKLEDRNNYLIISTSPKILVYNEYKTAATYKQQDFELPVELDSIIDEYIKSDRLKEGDFLFHQKQDKRMPINEPNFSKLIGDIFQKVYGVRIINRNIRRSAATSLKALDPSLEQMKEKARELGHSIEEQLKYRKFKGKK